MIDLSCKCGSRSMSMSANNIEPINDGSGRVKVTPAVFRVKCLECGAGYVLDAAGCPRLEPMS